MNPLPSTDIWAQFPLLAVVTLLLAAAGYALRTVLHDLTSWISEQDAKRDAERDRQREWEAKQAQGVMAEREDREKSWQEFFQRISRENQDAIIGNSKALQEVSQGQAKLLQQFDAILQALQQHDQRAEREFGKLNGPARRGGKSGEQW